MDNVIAKESALPYRTAGRQLICFSIVGFANTILDFSVYVGMTRLFFFWSMHIVAAAAVSFTAAAASSFVLNNFWTFRQDAAGMKSRSFKFFIVAVGGLGWSAATLWILTSLGMYDILAKIMASGVALVWNFTLQKKWTFRS